MFKHHTLRLGRTTFRQNGKHTQTYEWQMVGPRETNDTIGTFSGRSSVELQRMRIELQVSNSPLKHNQTATKYTQKATLQPRACLTASDHHVNYTLRISEDTLQAHPELASSARSRHARDRPQAPQSRKLIHANPAARCDAGWKDGETGPYDVGNMRMHSRFPNSWLSLGVETCFHWHLLFSAY
jgi:hypothetical protein